MQARPEQLGRFFGFQFSIGIPWAGKAVDYDICITAQEGLLGAVSKEDGTERCWHKTHVSIKMRHGEIQYRDIIKLRLWMDRGFTPVIRFIQDAIGYHLTELEPLRYEGARIRSLREYIQEEAEIGILKGCAEVGFETVKEAGEYFAEQAKKTRSDLIQNRLDMVADGRIDPKNMTREDFEGEGL